MIALPSKGTVAFVYRVERTIPVSEDEPFSEKVKLCFAIHVTLEHLELVVEAFDSAVAELLMVCRVSS